VKNKELISKGEQAFLSTCETGCTVIKYARESNVNRKVVWSKKLCNISKNMVPRSISALSTQILLKMHVTFIFAGLVYYDCMKKLELINLKILPLVWSSTTIFPGSCSSTLKKLLGRLPCDPFNLLKSITIHWLLYVPLKQYIIQFQLSRQAFLLQVKMSNPRASNS